MKKLLLRFFENEKYIGWKNIASELIKKGSCNVAGLECIWKGGIGNFITVEQREDYIGCVTYYFNLEEFKKSAWFNEIKELHLSELREQLKELDNKMFKLEKEIKELL